MNRYILSLATGLSLILSGSLFAQTGDASLIQQNQTQDIQKMERDRMNANPVTDTNSTSNTTYNNQKNNPQSNKTTVMPVDPSLPAGAIPNNTGPVNNNSGPVNRSPATNY